MTSATRQGQPQRFRRQSATCGQVRPHVGKRADSAGNRLSPRETNSVSPRGCSRRPFETGPPPTEYLRGRGASTSTESPPTAASSRILYALTRRRPRRATLARRAAGWRRPGVGASAGPGRPRAIVAGRARGRESPSCVGLCKPVCKRTRGASKVTRFTGDSDRQPGRSQAECRRFDPGRPLCLPPMSHDDTGGFSLINPAESAISGEAGEGGGTGTDSPTMTGNDLGGRSLVQARVQARVQAGVQAGVQAVAGMRPSMRQSKATPAS